MSDRNFGHINRYINRLYGDIYPQPEDAGHTTLAQKVIDHWCSRMTTCHSVLDVGAGTGFCERMFQHWGMEYTGIALGEDVVVAQSLGRNVHRMDFSFLDYEDNSFDLIFSRHSLEHSPMPLLTLMEWGRAAKSWLGIVLPAPEWYGYKGRNHYSVMNMDQITNMLEQAGWYPLWTDIDSRTFNTETNEVRPHEYWIMCEKRR